MNELFSYTIKSENAIFRYAKGPSVEPGKEFHPFHEIIYFMKGNAEFISEQIHCKVAEGTVIIIPKETYHQLIIHDDPNEYLRCTIKFDDIKNYKDTMRITELITTDNDILYLFSKMIENKNSNDSSQVLDAILTLLLNRFLHKENSFSTNVKQNTVIRCALEFINDNLYSDINITQIAKKCMISPSSLSHIFKTEMGISPHKFIVKKRLINAYRKIADGEPSTRVASECGFDDYSGFYKQYKKMFGVRPSKIKSEMHK